MDGVNIDLRSLPLHDLLSAPLTAAMEAEQQASLRLVSFIQDVGFTAGEERTATVRTIEFRYTREGRNADGKPVTFDTVLRIPLLAMLSLPRLEVETLNVNVLVALQSVQATEVSPRLGIPRDLQERYPFLQGHSSLRVAPASRTTVKGTQETTRPYDVEITLAAASDDQTDGMQRILTALTGMIAEDTR